MTPATSFRLLPALLCCCLPAAEDAAATDWSPIVIGEVLHADELELIGLRFTDVVALPRLGPGAAVAAPAATGEGADGDGPADARSVLRFDQLAAKAYGGRVGGSIVVDLRDGSIAMELALGELRIGSFLARFAGNDELGFDGVIDGRLALTLPQGRWERAVGHAELTLARGSVVSVPALAALLLGDPESGRGTDSGRAELRIEQGRVRIVECRIDNPAYQVQVKGDMDADGRLQLRVSPFAHLARLKEVPALGDVMSYLLGELSGRAARFEITGHVSDPQIEYSPF